MKPRMLLSCLTLSLLATSPLLAASPEINEQLRQAALKGDVAAVKGLLEKGAEVDAATEFGATALIFAADRGYLEVVKLLVDRGADVNRKDTTYKSAPISWAAYNGHAEIVSLLLQRGAAEAADTLDAAIDRGHLEVAKAVLASGKVPKESLGPALAAAKQENKTEFVELLEKAGAMPLPKASSVASPETLATYTGAYRNDAGFELAVSLDDGRLMVTVPGQPPLELSPKEPNLFQLVGAGPVTVSFNTEAGQVTGITLKPPDPGTVFKKVRKEVAP